jgi:type IV pilus assembly protein PilX
MISGIQTMPTEISAGMPARQRGAALITSLLLLIVLTLIGITVMQVSRMQERMTGNARDLNTAFQSAEAALRNGEELIRVQTSQPVPCSAAPCTFWTQGTFMSTATFVATPLGTVDSLTPAWWDANATQFKDDAGNVSLTGPKSDPEYIIEDVGFVSTTGPEIGVDPPVGREFYQISARSTGASGLTDVVVQSTYARKF